MGNDNKTLDLRQFHAALTALRGHAQAPQQVTLESNTSILRLRATIERLRLSGNDNRHNHKKASNGNFTSDDDSSLSDVSLGSDTVLRCIAPPASPIAGCSSGSSEMDEEDELGGHLSGSSLDEDEYQSPRRAINSEEPRLPDSPDPFLIWKCEPNRLASLFNELGTLTHQTWIGGFVLDCWLMERWISLGRPPIRYIETTWFAREGLDISPAEIERFRTLYSLPLEGPCPKNVVVGIAMAGQSKKKGGYHYFVLVFDPAEQKLHVLGRRHNVSRSHADCHDWETWQGDVMWRRVAILHGWDAGTPTVLAVDWQQNGYDCAATSSQVIEIIWAVGFQAKADGTWRMPHLPCAHALRHQMATDLFAWLKSGIVSYREIVTRLLEDDDPFVFGKDDSVVDGLQATLAERPEQPLLKITTNLQQAIKQCKDCLQGKSTESGKSIQNRIKSIAVLKNARPSRKVDIDEQPSEGDEEIDQESDEDSSVTTGKEEDCEDLCDGLLEADWVTAVLGRFGRPKSAPELPELKSLRGLWPKFSPLFDEYENGPTLDVLDPIPDTVIQLGTATLTYLSEKITTNPWTTFKDYGWRLLPSFATSFHMQKPIMVREHIMPVGLRSPPQSLEQLYHTTRSGKQKRVQDLVDMGPTDMIRAAEKAGKSDIFITGVTDDKLYVRLDIFKDAVKPQKIIVTADIDSFNWITRSPIFNTAIHVYELPQIRNKPPIWKHNHTYIDLLIPQSEADQSEFGPRNEWWVQRVKLNQIPHVAFGKLADGQGSVNVYMFFPRMTHKQEFTRYWANMVPSDIQNQLWEWVILRAMQDVTTDFDTQYMGTSLSQTKFRRGRNGQNRTPSHPLRQEVFTRLVARIRKIVEDDEALGMFGSHFYVVEVKGCKRLTKEVNGEQKEDGVKECLSNAWKNFLREFSCLSETHLLDRSRGEVFFDIGITFNPVTKDVPLVGLWRLDSLEATYGAGGYLTGNMHHLNTLELIGGLQAEMSNSRCERTHVVSRISYNLVYEVVRQMDNSRSLFDEKEACELDKGYFNDVDQVIDLFSGPATKASYGVRDEYRIGGQGLQDMIEAVDELTQQTIESSPFIFLPAATWFAFLRMRIEALKDAQVNLYQRDPLNYGILTGLLTFMLQSVLFTPPRIHSFVSDSLARLRYKGIVERFKMLFLHDWDLSRNNCLLGVVQEDSLHVYQTIGVNLRPKRFQMPTYNSSGGDYPLGPTPSWKEVTICISETPWKLMRPWVRPDILDNIRGGKDSSVNAQACSLFCAFTAHVWAALNSEHQRELSETETPSNVEAALKCWTLEHVYDRLKAPMYIACNAGLQGDIKGRKLPSFLERRPMYFKKDTEGLRGRWAILAQDPGYIYQYTEICESLEEEQVGILDSCLEELLSKCQTLPRTPGGERSDQLWETKAGKVCIFTNPKYYRLQVIGTGGAPEARTRAAPAQIGKKQLKVALLKLAGFDYATAARAVNYSEKLEKKKASTSAKVRNQRKPPVRKTKDNKLKDEENDEGAEDLDPQLEPAPFPSMEQWDNIYDPKNTWIDHSDSEESMSGESSEYSSST